MGSLNMTAKQSTSSLEEPSEAIARLHIKAAERKMVPCIHHLRLRPDYGRAGEEYWRAARALNRKECVNECVELLTKSANSFSLGKDFLRAGKVLEEKLVLIQQQHQQEGAYKLDAKAV